MAGFSWRRGGLAGPSLWREEDRVGGAAARLVASPSKSESKAGVDGLPRMIQCWTPNASPGRHPDTGGRCMVVLE